MRRSVHLLACCVSFLLGFILFCLYGGFGNPGQSYFRLPPATRYNLKEEDKPGYGDIGILQNLGVEFLEDFKNPCWYEYVEEEKQINFYEEIIKSASRLRYVTKKNSGTVLRCLPYFFLVGQPKCGTTDIFQRINSHPDVIQPALKGPHWWTRRRYGQPSSDRPVSFMEYLALFNYAASKIEEQWVFSGERQFHERITGDGSTSTLWDSSQTMTYLYSVLDESDVDELVMDYVAKRNGSWHVMNNNGFIKGRTKKFNCCYSGSYDGDYNARVEKVTYSQNYSIQPGAVLPVTVADVIHSVIPKSKIIAVIREPVSRLYSSYLFFNLRSSVSPERFDILVRSSLEMWENCTAEYSVRSCAYNKTLQNSMGVRLYNGLYSVFLCDWLKVFPREQVLVVRMEDYHQNMVSSLATIYSHLGLRPLTEEEEELVNIAPIHNKSKRKKIVGKMLNSTAYILQDFYRRFNADLAELLGDSKFTWEDTYATW
ncbi:carbohydrate sulfotransferase 15-like isoform X1 [Penaeus japonicus]|uniref:carbohydrate sulfotransferase 15-like isoform X1 n=1 Tax=Penaeus japonicus TaxID=27405 RepID=UPI001C716609|nr:carbohydrate sulfotransferase 15-like isoform X1 [Penaeus japonicus]